MSELNLLDYKVLTGVLQKLGNPPELLGKTIFKDRTIDGLSATWDVVTGNRTLGAFRAPEGKSKNINRLGVEKKVSQLALLALNKQLPETFLVWKRAPGTIDQPYMEQAIRRELEDLNNMLERTYEYARWNILTTGKLTVNQSDVKFEVDYGIANDHKPMVDVSWGEQTATPMEDISAWKRLVAKDSGYVITDMYMNSLSLEKCLKSESIRELLRAQYGRELVAGQTPPEIIQVKVNVYDAGYVNGGGSFVNYIPDGKVIFVASAPDFAEEQVGSGLIPLGENNVQKAIGKYSYTDITKDPVSLLLYAGKNALPLIKRVENIVIANIVHT